MKPRKLPQHADSTEYGIIWLPRRQIAKHMGGIAFFAMPRAVKTVLDLPNHLSLIGFWYHTDPTPSCD